MATTNELSPSFQFLLSEGRTVVKCISECNQSGCRSVCDLEPAVAMLTTFCGCHFFQQPSVMKVIPLVLPRIPLAIPVRANCAELETLKEKIMLGSNITTLSRVLYFINQQLAAVSSMSGESRLVR